MASRWLQPKGGVGLLSFGPGLALRLQLETVVFPSPSAESSASGPSPRLLFARTLPHSVYCHDIRLRVARVIAAPVVGRAGCVYAYQSPLCLFPMRALADDGLGG